MMGVVISHDTTGATVDQADTCFYVYLSLPIVHKENLICCCRMTTNQVDLTLYQKVALIEDSSIGFVCINVISYVMNLVCIHN